DGKTIRVREGQRTDRATLLITARVPSWTTRTLPRDVPAADFDHLIRQMADDAGLRGIETVPFLIEGTFADVRLHVINGACPMTAREGDKDAPIRVTIYESRGTLVGVYATHSAGVLTHHDTQTHVHAMLDGPPTTVGHVDSVSVRSGALVRFPKR